VDTMHSKSVRELENEPMRRAALIIGVLVVGLTIGGYVVFNGERKAPVRYRSAPVERGLVVSLVTATGTINPVVSVQVGTQVSGMIKSLHADFNSVVKAGDIVAVIDPEPFKARRDQAASNLEMSRANVARVKTDLAQRKRELDRVRSLVAQQFVSQNDVDVAATNFQAAEAQMKVVEAQVKQAEAVLNAAELDLKYTIIRSPVNGIVVARNVEVGQTIAASFATPNLFLIALDLTKMQVDTNVSESDIGGITEGKEAAFTVDAYPGYQFDGTIRQVRLAPINVQNVVTYNVVVNVDNQDLRLKPGMTANVSIVVAQRDAVLKVPNAALRFTPPSAGQADRSTPSSGKPTKDKGAEQTAGAGRGTILPSRTIWKQGPSGELEPLHVQTGISDGLATEIVSEELSEGALVVVGIERPKGDGNRSDLPPGFGSGGQRSPSRNRGR
ncbi:MAG: efflux RND transporter periplasmic adaptor subunit, partial [Nitrospiraceae bacterium]